MAPPHSRWEPQRPRWLSAVLVLALAAASVRDVDAQQPGGDYRLPGDVIPENYVLKMVPYLEVDNMMYTGTVDILVTAAKSTSKITLHAHADLILTVTDVVDQDAQRTVGPFTLDRDKEKQFLVITVHTTLTEGKKYIVSLSFKNTLQKDNYGFYVSSYDVPGGYEYMATTHFEATSARKAFPCFDEPMYRATFDISLAKLDDQIALSNMPPVGDPSQYDPSIGNRRWVTFQQTPKMPTYLVAFVVSKLKQVPTSNENINIYVRANAVDSVTKAAEVTPKLLTALENFLGLKYPLPKIDLVAIPDFPAGAMENWGLITFKEDELLVTKGVSTADREPFSLRVIAHEFTHLWFGDLVTLKWWNTIWQQEGMAAFFESYILDKATDSAYDQMSRFGTTRAHSALEADALEHSPPLTKDDIETPASIEDHFGTITYSKGSNVHYMLMRLLGEGVYAKGLHHYLTSNEYSATTIDDFAKALQDVADQDDSNFPLKGQVQIQDLVNSWGKQSGYPVLTILRNYDSNKARVSQSRFLAHEPQNQTAKASTWIIPYAINSLYSSEDNLANVLGATNDVTEIALPMELEYGKISMWANAMQADFFRVNYDMTNWLRLANYASSMDAAARASTIDDLFALDRAGLIDTWIPLHYLQKTLGDSSFTGERDIAPWLAGAKALRGYAALIRGDPETSTYFQQFTATILKPAFQAIGWESDYDEDYNRFRKSVVRDTLTQLACDAGLSECRRKALKTYNTLTVAGTQEIYDPNVLAATTCEGAHSFTFVDLAALFSRVENTEDLTARASLLRGAGCIRDRDVLTTLLEVTLQVESGLSSGEVLSLLKSVMDHSPDGCDFVLNYISTNFEAILKIQGQSGAESFLLEIARRMYNQDQFDKIKVLADKYPSNAMMDLTAVARATLTWVNNNQRVVKEWAAAQIGVSPPRAPFLITPSVGPTITPTMEPRPTEPPQVTSDWLLPDNLQPNKYTLDIKLEMDNASAPFDFTFEGTVAIEFVVVKATDKIVLHRHESLNVTVEGVRDSSQNVPTQGAPTFDLEKEFITINMKSSLEEGKTYTVSLKFKGPLQPDLAGLYVSAYEVGNVTKFLAVTQFEQTSARKAFPCFDEPKYRASFTISLTKLKSNTALSNMPAAKTDYVDTDHNKVTFTETPAMPTYLVALLVSELKEVPVAASPTKISIWVREGHEDEVTLAKELAPKVLKKLEDLTGIKYALPKLDLAAIPYFAPGAMENWGLITFKDTVLRTPKNALAHRRFNCARDITHEFSHLWFGDLVTNNWWSSLWQQEGMAAFMEAWVLDQATDYEYDAVARQSVDRIEQGLMDDALETAGPITNHTVGSPDQINEHAGEITYNKGAGFLRMIRAILGERTMWKGLRIYLSNHEYSTAGPDDLASAFQEAAKEDGISLPFSIKEIMDSWTLKKGFPVLDVERYLHDGLYTVKQSRFLSYEPTNATATAEQWIVPYNCEQLYSKGGKPFNRFLSKEMETVYLDLKANQGLSYVICNTEQEGFYRVNYDITTWNYLARALKLGMVESDVQRGALYDDAFTLLRARRTEPWVVLSLLENGVPGDVSLPVWGALNKGLSYLQGVLSSDSDAAQNFNTFVIDLTQETFGVVEWYNYWGWEETVQTNEVRQIVSRLACDAGEELCSDTATTDDYQKTNYVIHQENYGAMLCSNFKGVYEVDNFRTMFMANTNYDQRLSIAWALGCVSYSSARQILLQDLVVDKDDLIYQSNEMTQFVQSMIIHGGEADVVEFITSNWDDLEDSLGKSKALELLQMAAENVHTEDQYTKIQKVTAVNPSIYMTVVERSAAHGLLFAQNELQQVKDYLAVYAGKQPPAPAPLQPMAYRLPGTVVPENYQLQMNPHMDHGDFHYGGSVIITAKVMETTDSIVMHSHKDLDVILLTVVDLKTDTIFKTLGTSFNELSEFYTINLVEDLQPGHNITITMQFAGKLQKDKLGFYLSSYLDGVEFKFIATTQFEQTYARKAFPCFDEPKYRAAFDISIYRKPSQIARSNMDLRSTSDPDAENEGKVLDTFETTPPMPTYLVAFIVSELQEVETTDNRIKLFVRPDAVPQAAFAAEIAPKILSALEDFTGVAYALPKLDLVGIPDFYFGAMENWGLCTFRENRLLYDEGSATTEYKIFVAEVIAHEFAHLWFGDYVTLDWWSSGWLKEGMAEFLEYYILNKVMSSDAWYPLSRLGVGDVYDGMKTDSLEYGSPLTDNTVLTQDQIAEHMGTYTYNKGSALNYMLMGVLGEENFRDGLNKYLTENKYGTATPEKYAAALQEVADREKLLPAGITILDIINSWSTKPGLPVVTLIRNYNENTVKVSQSRYLSVTPQDDTDLDSKWIVPLEIFFSYGSEPSRFTAYMQEDQDSITINTGGTDQGSGSLQGNWLQQGYYHTNYDILNWIRLGSELRQGVVDPMYRAGLIHDAFALAKVSLVDPWVPLFLLEENLPAEDKAAPWQVAYDGLRMFAALVKADPEADRLYQTFLRTDLAEIGFANVGWDSTVRGNTDGKVARDYASKLACSARVADCRSKAYEAYLAYKEDPSNVDPNTLASALCEGLTLGDTTEYTSLYEDLVVTTERSRRMSIVYALGCIKNATNIKQLLDFGGRIQGFEPQEVRPLYRSILDNNPQGVDLALDYAFNNYEYLIASLGQSSADAVVLTIAERVQTYEQLHKLWTFKQNIPSKALTDAYGVASTNYNWASTQLPILKDYLAAKLFIVPASPTATDAAPEPSVVPPTAGPTPAPTAYRPGGEWRLDGSITPKHYTLEMVPFLEVNNFKFQGRVEMNVLVNSETQNIVMHAKDLNIPEYMIENDEELNVKVFDAVTGQASQIDAYSMDPEKDFLTIALAASLKQNNEYNISMEFLSNLRTDNFGFYVSSYIDGDETKYMATTHFEATSARKAFPCFDEPIFRATFDISVARLPGQTALSNMPIIRTSDPDMALGGRVWDDFETTPSMPTYLVAFMVHELSRVPTSRGNINIWVRPDAKADAGVAAEIAPQAVKAMEDYTGVKLPVPKIDLVAIPTFPIGAMENWGLATFREDYIINPKKAKSDHAFTCANVIMHELSHFWFGDLVTIEWWSSAWLKEGMASFLELYMLDKADKSKYSAYDRIIYEHVENAMVVDARVSADVLTNLTVGSPAEISDHMGIITYSKGGSFLRMIMTLVGEKAFQKGLSDYISTNAFYWGTPEKLANALQSASEDINPVQERVTVDAMFNSWTLKQGYPVLTFVRDRENGIGTITQERFLSHEPTPDYDNSASWHVPFNVWIQGQPIPTNYTDVLNEGKMNKTILLDDTDNKFVLINADQTGFYRVNYDLLTWIYINIYLPEGQINSALQRTALFDDSFTLALAGRLDSWVPLATMQAGLPSETELEPWIVARNALFRLRAILGDDTDAVALLDAFALSVVTPSYISIDWDSRWPSLEALNTKMLRDVLSQIACTSGDPTCRRSADYDYEGWFFDTAASTNADTLAATICEGMADIPIDQFAEVWARFLTEEDPSVRAAYLYGFGCVNSPVSSDILRFGTTHDGIKSNEAKIYLNSFITHHASGVQVLLDFLSNNYDDIKQRIGVQSLVSILQLVAGNIVSESQLKTINTLVKVDPCIEMTVVNQTAKMSLKWAQDERPLVIDFLQAAAGLVPPTPQPPSPTTTPDPLPTYPTPDGAFRLPVSVLPEEYVLQVVPYLSGEKTGTFDGEVNITVNVADDVGSFFIHANGLTFGKEDIVITDSAQNVATIFYVWKSDIYEWVEIIMDDYLIDGETYVIKISYTGKFSDDLKGLYLTSQEGTSGRVKAAVTNLAPTYARRVYPCFDEPSIRAKLTLTVGHLPTETVVSNTAAQSTSQPDASIGNRVLTTFKTTEKIASHSVTIVVAAGLQSVSSMDGKVTVYGTDALVAKAADTLTAVQSLLATMESLTGTPSGIDSLALVGVKDMLVEGNDNWAIDILREDALVNRDASPSAGEAVIYWLTTMAHRLSQHWFGNLVSMAWWDNVWLTDGFATYFQYKAASLIDLGSDLMLHPATFDARVVSPALAMDAMESAIAIKDTHVIGSTAGIEKSLNPIPGLKGAAIINSLSHILGETAFKDGLKTYLSTNRLSGVSPDAFYSALNSAVDSASSLPDGTNIDEVARSWVDNAGYPVVEVLRYYESNTASITQERFLLHSPIETDLTEGDWWVPVSASTHSQYAKDSSTARISGWVAPSDEFDITLPDNSTSQWLIVNRGRKGFFRVNYDLQNWLLLTLYNGATPDNFELLDIPTRVMLLDDAITLARSGRLDYLIALQYADYLRNEYRSHEVFEVAREVFGAHVETFVLESKLDAVYKTWVDQLIGGAGEYFDFPPSGDDTDRVRVGRGIVMEWACDLDINNCVKPALISFVKWLDDKDSVPHDTLAATVCAGSKGASATDFTRAAINLGLEENDVYRKAIIRGLGCVQDFGKAAIVMQLTAEGKGLRNGEALEMFKSVTRFGPSHVEAALDYLIERVTEVDRVSGMDATISILSMIAGRVTTSVQYTKLQTVTKTLLNGLPSPKLTAALQLAADNLKWHDANLDQVGDLLYALTGVPNPDLPTPPTTLAPPTNPAMDTTPTYETTWFTLPPTAPSTTVTLPPLPPRTSTTTTSTTTTTTTTTTRTTPTPPASSTPKSGANGVNGSAVVVYIMMLLASLIVIT